MQVAAGALVFAVVNLDNRDIAEHVNQQRNFLRFRGLRQVAQCRAVFRVGHLFLQKSATDACNNRVHDFSDSV